MHSTVPGMALHLPHLGEHPRWLYVVVEQAGLGVDSGANAHSDVALWTCWNLILVGLIYHNTLHRFKWASSPAGPEDFVGRQ